MKSFTTLVVSVLAALPYVAAHGFVSQVKIDGKSYKGRTPGSNNADSVIRTISSQNPIKGAHNPAVNCGTNAKRANLIADANPGSRLEFFWNGADMSHWPHNIGPIISYLAECDGPCNQYDSTRAKWFKIDQKGKKSNSNTWVQQDLFDSKPVSVTLPDNLKAGNYLLRHEIIALHLATDQGGAEFYASCTQLRVGGNGRGVPSPNELVSIPGAYNDNDAGIYVPGVFGNGNYKMPGPAIAKLVQGAPGNNGDNDDDNNNGGNNGGPKPNDPKPTPGNGGPKANDPKPNDPKPPKPVNNVGGNPAASSSAAPTETPEPTSTRATSSTASPSPTSSSSAAPAPEPTTSKAPEPEYTAPAPSPSPSPSPAPAPAKPAPSPVKNAGSKPPSPTGSCKNKKRSMTKKKRSASPAPEPILELKREPEAEAAPEPVAAPERRHHSRIMARLNHHAGSI